MIDEAIDWVLMTVSLGDQSPTLSSVAKIMDLPESVFDADFGLAVVDRDNGIFAIQVRADAVDKERIHDTRVKGPFSNPKIGPLR